MDYVSGIGVTNLDILYSGLEKLPSLGEEVFAEGFDIQLGGGVPATLINLSRLGVPARLSSYLGQDLFSDFVAKEFEKYANKYNFDYINLYEGNSNPLTITSIMITETDRTFASYNNPVKITKELEDKIYDNLKGAKVILMQLGYLEVYKRLKTEDNILVFDTGWDDNMSIKKYQEYLELADYFTPNQKEALKITGTNAVEDAAKSLRRYFDKVIIKLDKDGCLCLEGDSYYVVPPMANVISIDSTGAGDAFLSGFIYGLYHGHSFKDSIIFGNITGGTSVQGIGCLTKYVNEEELLEKAKQLKANFK